MVGTAPGRSLLTTDALAASVSAQDCRDRQARMGKIVVCAERVVDAPDHIPARLRGHQVADPLIFILASQQFLPQLFIHAAISPRRGP